MWENSFQDGWLLRIYKFSPIFSPSKSDKDEDQDDPDTKPLARETPTADPSSLFPQVTQAETKTQKPHPESTGRGTMDHPFILDLDDPINKTPRMEPTPAPTIPINAPPSIDHPSYFDWMLQNTHKNPMLIDPGSIP
jgi:hypothetical protein